MHTEFFYENREKIRLIIILGDDMLAYMSARPDVKDLKKYIKVNFNMISKSIINDTYGTFCHMLSYKMQSEGRCGLGPDYVYLDQKYELLSTTYDEDVVHEIAELRSMSYAMIIGNTPEIAKLV